ncbi:unnamed protein product, partial [Rangifer tarandus platyrhynchus]
MKLFIGILFCTLIMGVTGEGWYSFFKEAVQGTKDMWRAFSDMREAGYIGADKYFHARGNYNAAQRGPGGVWAAKSWINPLPALFLSSDARETLQGITDPLLKGMTREELREDTKADQFANEWGGAAKTPTTSDLLACLTST